MSEAVSIAEAMFGKDHTMTADGLTNLARISVFCGDPASGLPLIDRALVIYRANLGADHFDLAEGLTTRIEVLHALGKRDPISEDIAKIKDVVAGYNDQKSVHLASLRVRLARILRRLGELQDAEQLCRSAGDALLACCGSAGTVYLDAQLELGLVLRAMGKKEEAEAMMLAVASKRKQAGIHHTEDPR